MSPESHEPSHDARPGPEELRAYALGKLSDAESERIAEYLDTDPACQAILDTLDVGDDTLAGGLRRPVDDDPIDVESQCDMALARAKAVAGRAAPEPIDVTATESLVIRVLGEYQLLDRLGRGGMGTVYKALHTKLDRVVALKVIARHRAHDPNAAVRFAREMKAIGRLDHPNIVRAFDAREVDDTPVLVMEYVDGLDLGELLRRHGPLATADACELARRAALGLQYAHENGLVHRDVKPSNLMLGRAGELKILDLGLARFAAGPLPAEEANPSAAVESDSPGARDATGSPAVIGLTGTNQAMGTADYMAPEQVSDPASVDIRADIYSLGCTLYKLLTGTAPFADLDEGGTLAKLRAHTERPARPIRELAPAVPERLAAFVDRMLAKRPEDRQSNPAEVAEALAPFCAGHDLVGLLARAEKMPARRDGSSAEKSRVEPQPAVSGRRFRFVAALVAVALLFGGLGLMAGILVTIRKGDQQVTIDVPDKAALDFDHDGNPIVTLPAESKAADATPRTASPVGPPTPVEPAPVAAVPDEQAIQGEWEVVEHRGTVEGLFVARPDEHHPTIGTTARRNLRPGDLDGAKVIISDKLLKVRGPKLRMLTGDYEINPNDDPRVIAVNAVDRGVFQGIYKIEGDRLTICSGQAGGSRPDNFWVGFQKDREQTVLRRIGDVVVPEDEKALVGTWFCTGLAGNPSIDGMQWPSPFLEQFVSGHTLIDGSVLGQPLIFGPDQRLYETSYSLISIDASAMPHTIEWHGRCYTWAIDGDRLRIRAKRWLADHRIPSDFSRPAGEDEVELIHVRAVADPPGHLTLFLARESYGWYTVDRQRLNNSAELEALLKGRVAADPNLAVTLRTTIGSRYTTVSQVVAVVKKVGAKSVRVVPSDGSRALSFRLTAPAGNGPLGEKEIERYNADLELYGPEPGRKASRVSRYLSEAQGVGIGGTPRPGGVGLGRASPEIGSLRNGLSLFVVTRGWAPTSTSTSTRFATVVVGNPYPGSARPVTLTPEDVREARARSVDTYPAENEPWKITVVNATTGDVYLPDSDTPDESEYGWYSLPTDIPARPEWITAEVRNRRYVLLSRKPDETLVAPPEGPIDWRVERAVAEKRSDGRWCVEVTLDEAGGKALGELTGAHVDRHLAAVVDGHVVCVPTIRTEIHSNIEISGNFTEDEAKLLAEYLSPP